MSVLKLPAHKDTSAQLAAAWPWLAGGQSTKGFYLGDSKIDNTAFSFSPFTAYNAGLVTGPNFTVLGCLGSAKSSAVKVMIAYIVALGGGTALVLDPKDEYRVLAQLLGTDSVSLKPGSGTRLNLLDGDPTSLPQVLSGIGRSVLGHPLNPIEESALSAALEVASAKAGNRLHLGLVGDALLRPSKVQADALNYNGQSGLKELTDATRPLALAINRLVNKTLAGVIDGPTSSKLLNSPLLVLDLSQVEDAGAMRVMLAAAMRWGAATRANIPSAGGGAGAGAGAPSLLLMDEAWKALLDPGTALAAQAAWKLARAAGMSCGLVLHRIDDLDTVGAADSTERALVHGLISDSETKIMFRQDPQDARTLGRLAGLSEREQQEIATLPRGCALWHVGKLPPTIVRHKVPSALLKVVDTDGRMRATVGTQ